MYSFRIVRAFKKAVSRKHSGFTLVELIVVITILAVLATIGFLALSGYSSDAKDSTIKANVRSVLTAISSESAITNNSSRYYVVHDAAAALTGSVVAYVDGSPVVLTGGNWNATGTNYSAGNPDWAKLKLNPEKFRLSRRNFPDFLQEVLAAYDPKSVLVGTFEATLAQAPSGKSCSTSFLQVAGVSSVTNMASVSGNYVASWTGSPLGLIKNPSDSSSTGAIVDGRIISVTPAAIDNFPNSALLSASNKTALAGWHGTAGKVWTLCFRATTHGFSSSTFHTNCNNKWPTISIYKFGTNLVGWYGSTSWNSASNYLNNSTSWLFNLNSGTRTVVNVYPQYAQYDNSSYWPTFWGGHDLYCWASLNGCYANQYSYSPNPAVWYVPSSTTATDLEVWY